MMPYHTEEQARKKWCPFVQCLALGDKIGTNRPVGKGTYCIASDCMMWEWGQRRALGANPDGSAKTYVEQGYCGLARKWSDA